MVKSLSIALGLVVAAASLSGRQELKVGVVNLKDCFDENKCAYAGEATAELKTLEADLERSAKEGTLTKEEARKKFIDAYSQRKAAVYAEIRRRTDALARDKKYDLILWTETAELDLESGESVSQQISHRVVLHHSATLDLTKEVLDALAAEHAKRGKKDR